MRSNFDTMIGINSTGFSEESMLKRFALIDHKAKQMQSVDNTIVILSRKQYIVTEDIHIITVYTITSAYASSNRSIEYEALNREY
jgi:hypothetical protein